MSYNILLLFACTFQLSTYFFLVSDYNIALLGMTGSGKSSLGNTLLCEDKFVLQAGLRSGTKVSQWAESTVDKIHLMVIIYFNLSMDFFIYC